MTARQTTEKFRIKVASITGNEYSVIGEYVNNNTKIQIQHNTCKSIYLVKPKGFMDGNRCPVCRNKQRGAVLKTTAQFISEVHTLMGEEYTVLGEYVGATKKICIQHNICGNSWEVSPNKFLSCGTRCPTCARNLNRLNQTYTTKHFEETINTKYPNEYMILGKYTHSKSPILVRHIPCGMKWKIKPSHLVSHNMCPRCKSSKGETFIREWLKNKEITFSEQHSFPNLKRKKCLTYDFYIPELNILIEYQGIQHYKAVKHFGGEERFKQQKENDEMKQKYAKENRITLVEVPYFLNTKEKIETYLDEIVM